MTKHNEGFTLVEMVVSILVGTIATAAVATLLLIGLRINATTTEIATRDNQVKIGLEMLRNVAKENEIVVEDTTNGWSISTQKIEEKNGTPETIKTKVLEYDKTQSAILVTGGTVLIDNVTKAEIKAKPVSGEKKLSIDFIIDEKSYPFTVYCRVTTS